MTYRRASPVELGVVNLAIDLGWEGVDPAAAFAWLTQHVRELAEGIRARPILADIPEVDIRKEIARRRLLSKDYMGEMPDEVFDEAAESEGRLHKYREEINIGLAVPLMRRAWLSAPADVQRARMRLMSRGRWRGHESKQDAIRRFLADGQERTLAEIDAALFIPDGDTEARKAVRSALNTMLTGGVLLRPRRGVFMLGPEPTYREKLDDPNYAMKSRGDFRFMLMPKMDHDISRLRVLISDGSERSLREMSILLYGEGTEARVKSVAKKIAYLQANGEVERVRRGSYRVAPGSHAKALQ